MAALHPGTRLGPYEVLSLIGAGGMGEVYRGRDTRLDRHVALKVLAPTIAPDADSRARFTREAKAVSALNHPHICGLYDIGRERDVDYLVLELLDGETLEERLRRGALPLHDVLRFGIEIADALSAAHLRGIVHRDLKPGNILLTRGGTKLLDFGLAKGIAPDGVAADLRTATVGNATASGTILGTLPYMSPEQVTGGPADARTDIFALGAVLYEIVTGRRAFEAVSQAGVVAKILEGDVPAAATLTPGVPFALDYLIQRCLAKDPADRWHSAHDLKLQLQAIQAQVSSPEAAPVSGSLARRTWLPWSVAALAVGVFVATAILLPSRRSPVEQLPAQLEIVMPSHLRIDSISQAEISPDGRHIVLDGVVQGRHMLFIRDLKSQQITALADTEGGGQPFWSPDSQSIGFFTSRELKRVGIGGGPVRELANSEGRKLQGGATWGRGVILFASADGSILQVPEAGGPVTAVATLLQDEKRAFEWPRFLPDGRRFLVTQIGDPAPYLASLDSAGLQKLSQEGSRAMYVAGHLLFSRGASAYARPFDPARLEFTGHEVLLAERADFLSASDTGTVLYGAERTVPSRLTWFDRRGNPTAYVTEVGEYTQVVLSPSGKWATVVQPDPRSAERNLDVWNVELATRIPRRLTTDPAHDSDPSWSPDEQRLAFTSARTGTGGVYVRDMVTGAEEPFVARDEIVVVDQWTPDGKFIIFRNAGRAVWSVAVSGDRTPRMLVDTTAYREDEVRVSYDGRWVAYNADLSGTWEVYVARFPKFTNQHRISSSGGVQPQWRADGSELFYLGLDGALMVVPFNSITGPEGRPPIRLFPTRFESTPQQPQYAVSRDGTRFLGLERMAVDRASLVVLFNGLTTQSAASPR